jgi:membrane-associated phospholipid phosphatase
LYKNYRVLFVCIIIFVFQTKLYGKNYEDSVVPISEVFHNIGWNALHSFTFNYGLNFTGAAAGTYILMETGADWGWRNIAYNNEWVSNLGLPGLHIGYIVPVITPVITYTTGRVIKDEKLQIAGLALAQSLVLTFTIQSSLKMITGRALPGIITQFDQIRDPRTDDFSREFDWFNLNFFGGWPSGHTANAFAAAAAVSEIYKDNLPLKIAVYSYASLIGLGVTLNVHWVSEVLAGALIGYAVGKTVGRDFSNLLNNKREENTVSFYFTPNFAGIKIRL